MFKVILPALAAVSLSVAVPVQAETASVEVLHSDLDLTTAQGVATLEGRIAAAVKKVCGAAESRNIRASADWQACRAGTEKSAYEQLARVVEAKQGIALASMLSTGRRG